MSAYSELLEHAAALLTDTATHIRNGHSFASLGINWPGPDGPEAKADYEDHIATAKALRKAVRAATRAKAIKREKP